MTLLSSLDPRRWFSRPPPRSQGGSVRARYDVAQTTTDNQRIWAAADQLSADAANRPHVRKSLRNRARYEVANNSYARGITLTLGNYVVGTGPRLQLTGEDEAINSTVEGLFATWAAEIGLAEKLRTMHVSRVESGECFALLTNNPRLQSPVKLDLKLVETDQVADPRHDYAGDPWWCDGIQFDDAANPVSYRILKQHPGSLGFAALPWDFDDVDAEDVLHYFRTDRPGQRRGIPDMTPALRQFNDLRRYSSAVIRAAEMVADYAAVIQSSQPVGDDDGPEAMDTVQLEKGMATVLPEGYSIGQIKAEQPTTTYDMFVWAILREICRCLNVPLTIGALDSSKSNLSAAYLDHQTFAMAVVTDRGLFVRLLDRLFAAWLAEARLIPGYLPAGTPPAMSHQWFWPSIGQHADPAKVATAQATRLASGMSTIPREYAALGLDWEDEQASGAKAFGLSVDDYREMIRIKLFGNGNAMATPGATNPTEDPTNDPSNDPSADPAT